MRVKPSGVKTFLIQYRNVEGRTRRLVLGQYGVLTPENARELAREKLAGVAKGEDPSAERHAVRAGMSVSDVCDWYLEEAEASRILGRNRRPIKTSKLKMDRSRIETLHQAAPGRRRGSCFCRDRENARRKRCRKKSEENDRAECRAFSGSVRGRPRSPRSRATTRQARWTKTKNLQPHAVPVPSLAAAFAFLRRQRPQVRILSGAPIISKA